MPFRRRRGSAGLPESGFLKRDALLIRSGWHNVRVNRGKDDPASRLRYTMALAPPIRLFVAPSVLAFRSRWCEVWGLKVGKPTGHVELIVISTHWRWFECRYRRDQSTTKASKLTRTRMKCRPGLGATNEQCLLFGQV